MLPITQLNFGDEIPIGGELQCAISLHAPGAPDVRTCRILANRNPTRIVVRVGSEVVVKYGTGVHEAEAHSLLFVASETTVPVPKLHGVLVEGDTTYIVMAHVQGLPLDKVWDRMTVANKEEVSQQLHDCFVQLHQLHAKYIGSMDCGPCVHLKLTKIPEEKRGPFETEQQMNETFADSCGFSDSVKSYTLSNLHSQHEIVFSHGNIRMNHILVEGSRVQAILDWGQSGYYPEHWDFVNATSNIDWDSDWGVYVQTFLKPYYEDFALWADLMGVLS